jgi:hypothetical protein
MKVFAKKPIVWPLFCTLIIKKNCIRTKLFSEFYWFDITFMISYDKFYSNKIERILLIFFNESDFL